MDKFDALNTKLDKLIAYTDNIYKQVEALISIYKTLDITHPLLPSRGWAISPDIGITIVNEILQHKPKILVEAGAGLSTLIAGHCFRKLGQGKIISLEHNENFIPQIEKSIELHALSAYVELLHAPLKEYSIQQKTWQWYDIAKLDAHSAVDMLIIDGPPSTVQTNARYPALPLLHSKLTQNVIIILDDAARADEKNIAKSWLNEYSGFQATYLNTEKGTIVLRRTEYASKMHY